MARFSASSVESLDYDFTGFDRADGQGQCKGKGTIPEPSEDGQERFAAKMRELFGTATPDAELNDLEAGGGADPEQARENKRQMMEALAEFCGGSPSAGELGELPPRIFVAFAKWISSEVSDPEVRSGATRA